MVRNRLYETGCAKQAVGNGLCKHGLERRLKQSVKRCSAGERCPMTQRRATDLTTTNATVGAQRSTYVSVRKWRLPHRQATFSARISLAGCDAQGAGVRDRVARQIWSGNLFVLPG